MRAIFNVHSHRAAKAAGWRAREVHIGDKRTATLDEILDAALLADESTMKTLIVENGIIKKGWLLYVNGIIVSGPSCLETVIKDNTQIHLMDTPG